MNWLLETGFGLLKFVAYTIWGTVSSLCPSLKKSALPDLSADVCVITGAGRGLGRELAHKFAACGATVVLWDINERNLKSVAEEIRANGGDAYYYVCDCSKNDQVQRTAESVREEVGNVAILVNNAGIVTGKSFVDSSEKELQKVIEVNTLAHFWTTKAFLPWMIENNYGYVISIASVLAFAGLNRVADYAASKAAIQSFTESLRHELIAAKKTGITVSCICPYHMDTGMFEGLKTRFPRILAPLDPALVAERTLKVLVSKDSLVIIPNYFRILIILKWVLPLKAFDELLKLIGANEAMKSFVGHSKNE